MNKFGSIILLCCIIILLFSGNTLTAQKKVAVVLSGGGAKGFTHVGVLKILEEEGIPIDIIVGTSIGGLVGGIYSIGYSADEIESLAKSADWQNILSDDIPRKYLSHNDKIEKQRYMVSLPFTQKRKLTLPKAIVKGQNVLNLFCGLTGNVPEDADFSEFPIPFACIGANLETGQEVVINNGFMPTALFSTMAIPGLFLPGEHNEQIMVDGGVVNNFPTDVAKKMGADIIIGVDLRSDLYTRGEIKSMGDVVNQLISFYSLKKDTANMELCDVLIRPDITGYNASSFNREAADTLIRRGMEAARLELDKIRELKRRYNLEKKEKSRKYITPDKWDIADIRLSGNHSFDDDLILEEFDLETPGSYSFEEIKDGIDRIYGFASFRYVFFYLTGEGDEKILNLKMREEKATKLNIGMRLNTTDAVSVVINATKKDYGKRFTLLSGTADISSNPELNFTLETRKKKQPAFGIQLNGKFQKFNLYEEGSKVLASDVIYVSGSAYMYRSLLKNTDWGIGYTQDYFSGNSFSSEAVPRNPVSNVFIANLYVSFSLDNLDKYYFPGKGTKLYTELALVSDLGTKDDLGLIYLLKIRNVIPLAKRYSLLFDLNSRSIFNSYTSEFKSNLVGGELYSVYFNNHLPFYGLRPVILANNYVTTGMLGLRFNFAKVHYVTLAGNILVHTPKLGNINDYDKIIGGALKYSMNSQIGPLGFTVGYSDYHGKLTFEANIGYWF